LLEENDVDHDTIVEDWRRNAKLHDDENYDFLRSLKFRDYGFEPDELAVELHERAFQIVDCTRCANCCKTLDIKITNADAERIAEHPDASTTSVVEALAAQGIRVEPAHVSVVRTMLQPPKPAESDSEETPKYIHITITPSPERAPPRKKKSSRKKPAASGGTADVKAVFEAIVGMTDAFCRDHLNDEYAELCRNLAAALARKRPSPLVRGQLETWAVGIIRTIGWVNFLDDSSNKPHLKLTFIDKAFGVAESTGQGKSKLIRKMLKIRNTPSTGSP
jgi:hypothetical protein